MIWKVGALFITIFLLLACTMPLSPGDGEFELTETDTKIVVDEDASHQIEEIAEQNPGGIGYGFHGTAATTLPRIYEAYKLVEGVFTGEFSLRSWEAVASDYVFVCFLNYRQTSCEPGAALAQHIPAITTGSTTRIPIQVAATGSGHDELAVIFQADPFEPGPADAPTTFQDRTLDDVWQTRIMLLDDTPVSPTIEYYQTPGVPGGGLIDRGFSLISNSLPARGSQGGWVIWTGEMVQGGEAFTLNLHFDDSEVRHYALVALLDFEQVPLYLNDVPHAPLFVQTAARVHHTIPVQIQVPETPGAHELRVVAFLEPFADLTTASVDGTRLSSARVLLTVSPPTP